MKTLLLIICLLLSIQFIFSCSHQQAGSSMQKDTVFVVNGNDTLRIKPLDKFSSINYIPPRYQWDSNGGYCGEVSMISAGLYYGQYMSQFDARNIASDSAPQNLLSSQLLLGQNDTHAAACMRLQYEAWDNKKLDHEAFLAWVKMHVLNGHPVIIGVYTNENIFYGDTSASAGDSVYDHIVPVIGFGSANDFDKINKDKYFADDVILFSDNGLYSPDTMPVPDTTVAYFFHYRLKSFLATRAQANNPNGNPYYLAGGRGVRNYAIAITGIMDKKNECLPVHISINKNYEAPPILDTLRPKPVPMKLTITVSHLKPHVKYNLYYYNNEKNVPVEAFNKNAKTAPWKVINISSGSTYTTTMEIMSCDKVFLRAVPVAGE